MMMSIAPYGLTQEKVRDMSPGLGGGLIDGLLMDGSSSARGCGILHEDIQDFERVPSRFQVNTLAAKYPLKTRVERVLCIKDITPFSLGRKKRSRKAHYHIQKIR